MDGPIEGGGGGGVFSGGSSHGSISTVSKEDNLVLSTEVSSSLAINAHELELGLGLSLGCGGTPTAAKSKSVFQSGSQYARILTAKDFPSKVSKDSSSSSPSIVKVNRIAPCGSKRSAESFSPPRSDVRNQIVGWPPVRPHRMNIIVNRGKSLTAENGKFATAERKNKNVSQEKSDGRNKNDLEKEAKKSQFVKVNMDGIPIGRKIDLNAHSCYETLAQTLDDMFCRPATCTASRQEQGVSVTEATGSLRLLDLLSEFVLTYEDKDGDWMLVGDVPWEMFIFSVKRLKIMRTSEANGLAPTTQQRNEGVRTKPI